MASRLYSMNKYINAVATKIYNNQTLCKYLYYDQYDPLAQPDIADTTILYTDEDNQRLLFNPFIVAQEDNRLTRLGVNIDDVDVDRTEYFKNISIDCILVCHNDLWRVSVSDDDIGVRPLLIMDELDSIFVDSSTKGIGSDKLSYSKLIYLNDYYTGYRICYKSISLPI